MKTLLVATRNAHKVDEIRAILSPVGMNLLSVDDVDTNLPDVEEDGDTFAANAIKKAVTLAAASGWMALADDSGLEVKALDNAPGVYSARYAGLPCDDEANNAKLLEAMRGQTYREARFCCVIALATPEGDVATVEGSCEGRLAESPRGSAGFGYDPLFIPNGYHQTFGELDASVKHRLSHRGAALRAAVRAWRQPDGSLSPVGKPSSY